MRLQTRNIIGLGAGAALALTATIGGVAAASQGADDGPALPGATVTASTGVVDDQGGLTPRSQRHEAGDDRRAVPSGSPTSAPTAAPSRTHDVGDDHGGNRTGSDDGPGHDVGDDHGGDRGRSGSGHGGGSGHDDGPGHDAGDDHGGHGSDG